MATNQTLDQVLAQALGPLTGSGSLALEMDRLTSQLGRLQSVNEAALQSARTNTQAVVAATSAASSSGGSSAAGTSLSYLGTGFGISPLIRGLTNLFGGGGPSEPAPLVKFALPSSLQVNAGVSAGAAGAFGVDYGQGNVPRPVTAAPQITVQVQAMDSRSFLDHSNDIAMAVRQAMLESSVLNDVVREA